MILKWYPLVKQPGVYSSRFDIASVTTKQLAKSKPNGTQMVYWDGELLAQIMANLEVLTHPPWHFGHFANPSEQQKPAEAAELPPLEIWGV